MNKKCALCFVLLVAVFVPIQALRRRRRKEKKEVHTSMVLQSTAFANDGKIPQQYTCYGENMSPPLRWLHPPKGTKSFVIFMDDLDKPGGGTFNHWVVYNLPATVTHLPMNATIEYYKGSEGANSYGEVDWDGPCPQIKPHRYRFTLYALNTEHLKFTNKKPQRDQVERAMAGKVLAKADLIGTFDRARDRRRRGA